MNKKLDDIEKKLKVPEGYFEELPMRIQKRIEMEQSGSPSFKIPAWSLAMAASIVVIIGFIFIWDGNNTTVEELIAEIPEEELIAYVEQLHLDAYDLAVAFPETTEELEFKDIEMMDELEVDDLSIDDILLEYNIEEEKLEI